jgi:hypothetical protein
MKRSKKTITKADLNKLLGLAIKDVDAFFERNPVYKKPFKGKHLLIALCQGAALHYIDRENGVKDFDVWLFYPKRKIVLPYRRRGVLDFGKSKFGKHPDDHNLVGRRVDVLMRSDSMFNIKIPELAISNYLIFRKTKTAKLLSQKAVIGLYPNKVFGKVLWPAGF